MDKSEKGIDSGLGKKCSHDDDKYDVWKALLGSEQIILHNLEVIRKEIVPNCRHPKKMRDRTRDGQEFIL